MAERTGIRNRVSDYFGNKIGGDSLRFGRDIIKESAGELSATPDKKILSSWWRGPSSRVQGQEIYAERFAKNFQGVENQAVSRLRITAAGLVFFSILLLVFAFLYELFVFRLGVMAFAGIILLTAFSFFHKSEQIRQRRVFGAKELFFK